MQEEIPQETNVVDAFLRRLREPSKYVDILFASALLAIIAVFIFPVSTWLLDILLCFSITISILILMTVLFVDKVLDFNSFPTILLIATMIRLALNISSTRLILSQGHTGTDAAGHVVEAFGGFVMQGSVVIGAIIFGILTIVNFVVITKGSGRIAEVAARFSLDAMPGKQMAIDADLSSGLIDESAAKKRRKELEEENTFFGAMDGANKFVRGDAVAGLLITFINFIGGLIIGIVQKDMTFANALQSYTALTIGDGLVSQIPSLIVSISAGMLVTKSGTTGSAEKAILGQLGHYPRSLGVTSGLLTVVAFMPNIPALPFLISSTTIAALCYSIYQSRLRVKGRPKQLATGEGRAISRKASDAAGGEPEDRKVDAAEAHEAILKESLKLDPMRLELGYELLQLINDPAGPKLIDQIKGLRAQIAMDLGFVLPSVRIKDNMELGPEEYVFKIKDMECARGSVHMGHLLVMDNKGMGIDIAGEDTREPVFNLAAKWIDPEFKEEALKKNYTVVDPSTVIITHITEIIRSSIGDLLTYSEVQTLIDNLPQEYQRLASEIMPAQITHTAFKNVLQGLISEGISIKDMPSILEAVSEVSKDNPGVPAMIEHVRHRLARQICNAYMSEEGYIPMVSLSPAWEREIAENISNDTIVLAPSRLQELVKEIDQTTDRYAVNGVLPAIITTPMLRKHIRSIVERFKPSLVVLSHAEIHPRSKIKIVGTVE